MISPLTLLSPQQGERYSCVRVHLQYSYCTMPNFGGFHKNGNTDIHCRIMKIVEFCFC